MIRRLPEPLAQAKRRSGFRRGPLQKFRPVLGGDVMRTGKSGEDAAGRKEAQGAQVQLVIAPKGGGFVALGFGEGRRIENDEVVIFPLLFAMAEKVEDVALDPFDGEPLGLRGGFGVAQGLGRLIDGAA